MIDRILDEKASQIVEIENNVITFCQRKATAKFEVLPNNGIKVSDVMDEGCGFGKLVIAIKEINSFVVRGQSVGFYNSQKEVTITMNFVMDLETARKLKEEQDLKKAEDEKQRQQRLEELRE